MNGHPHGEEQHEDGDAAAVWVFDPGIADFHEAVARRLERDLYEIIESPDGSEVRAGDSIWCELSDGELVCSRIFDHVV